MVAARLPGPLTPAVTLYRIPRERLMMTDPVSITLPPTLAALRDLAYNLRWSWHDPTRALFAHVDADLWQRSGHNPVALLAGADRARLAELAADRGYCADVRAQSAELRDYLGSSETWYARRRAAAGVVAYFSAEYGITECLRIFSGGLGVLAGDHLKSASDLGVPLVGVGLFYSMGYFTQQVDADGNQRDVYQAADPRSLPLRPVQRADGSRTLVCVPMRDHVAFARIWRADVGRVPLYLLDTNVLDNRPEDRRITDRLYGGDSEHRLEQEIVLGIGGMRALRAAGHEPRVIHLNEGHAAFAALERARGMMRDRETFRDAVARSSHGVVFTTHTPVAAGHDYFPHDLLERHLGGYMWELREPWDRFLALGRAPHDDRFCMTALAIRCSARRNGVSRLHGAVSRTMWRELWPGAHEHDVPISHITNGVHLPTWVGPSFAQLYADRIGADWREGADELHWHRASHIPLDDIMNARDSQRADMIAHVRHRLAMEAARRGEETGWTTLALAPDALSIVFARRFATYKRATLLLSQPERLLALLHEHAPGAPGVQFIFAGKAHPRDVPGQALLKQVAQFARRHDVRQRFVFLEDYDVQLARHLVQGADIWLNVPLRPYEASGTSGMKAAANGGLNLSIADGWWAEAWQEHNRLPEAIGWTIGGSEDELALDGPETGRADRDRADADALFDLLEREVVPLFREQQQGRSDEWARRIRASLRQCGGFFNTHRMVREYADQVYNDAGAVPAAASEPRAARR
jgi:glycogen phosphorylase